MEAVLQIHSGFVSHSIKLRAFQLSSVTVSLHYLPGCVHSAVACGEAPTRY